ncbi:hypothetical protein LIER_00223 [Lithospermum erythrorhizon]|uniref:Neprosin PEP catalytic domain-containing protein n=1 Tax=Lithospermum erythrorhizon TaxID=34254 RepID=A0AAV3NH42_LITER
MIRAHLRKINKPGMKTIKSPDGDIIDCVLSHQQLAFDHPELKGQKPLDPPERPRGYNSSNETNEVFQPWSMSGESCPEGTVPVRRVTEEDILEFHNISTFGRKTIESSITNDSPSNGHEYAIEYVSENAFYGGKANINVWAPRVELQTEFSLSQIWIVAGTDGVDLNTIEAGWQVHPQLYKGDRQPRLFTYWTKDGYKGTGCYNLICPGFVQISKKIAVGSAITPVSSYGGHQFQITLLIWKDPKNGNWWLQYGGELVGYWPSVLFTHLKDHATMVQFGGEIVNSRGLDGSHTSTQMGSGHFAEEGDGKASFFRNLQVVDEGNSLVPPQNIKLSAQHPNCYDIKQGFSQNYGNYFNYGGPGKNPNCP